MELFTKPCQMGKTEGIFTKFEERLNSNTPGYHTFEIFITNKSLLEVKQFTSRIKNKFGEDFNIITLSSAKEATFNKLDELKLFLFESTRQEDLPNCLVMCFHDTRVSKDLVELVTKFNNRIIQNNLKIQFYLTFDEPDANMGVFTKFYTSLESKPECLKLITFVTATPCKTFWKSLKELDIDVLANMTSGEYIDFEPYKDYKSVRDHNFVIYNEDTKDPCEYIQKCFETNLIPENQRNIIFAPANIKKEGVGSHKQVLDYFKSKGNYFVLIINSDFKGFIFPNGKRVSLRQFNEVLFPGEEDIQLTDTLRKWNQKYPKRSLAITGNSLIERGMTFNTDGFNFTHIILSNYHLKNDQKLIQLGGRGSGKKEYVDTITYICPKKVKDTLFLFDETQERIQLENPASLKFEDFKIRFRNKNIMRRIFNTYQEYVEFHHQLKASNPLYKRTRPCADKPISVEDDRFKENNIRSIEKIYSLKEVLKEHEWGINKNSLKRLHVCYEDVNDPSTEKYVLAYLNKID